MDRLLVIENPRATNARPAWVAAARRLLADRFALEWRTTAGPGDGRRLAGAAGAEGFSIVAVLGGDGTVNEAVNGLVELPPASRPALALLPAGQADVLARIYGIPRTPHAAAAKLLAQPRRRALSLGEVSGRRFTFAAGIGLDAEVAGRVDARPGRKARFGSLYYAAVAVATARRYRHRPPDLEVVWEGGSERGLTVAFQTTPTYTYFREVGIALNPPPPGSLGGAVLKSATAAAAATVFWRGVVRRRPLASGPPIQPLPPQPTFQVKVRSGGPLPLQVDGDLIELVGEATFSTCPEGVELVC
jgi:diacylglycerol kinase family enzyme